MTNDLRAAKAIQPYVSKERHERNVNAILAELEPTKPAEPEAEKSLGQFLWDSYRKWAEQWEGSPIFFETLAAELREEVLRRADVEQLRNDLANTKSCWDCSNELLVAANAKVKQLESELKSAAAPTSEEIVQLVREGFMTCSSNTPSFGRHTVEVVFNNLPQAQQLHGLLLGLNADDAKQIDAATVGVSEQVPTSCLDIDGNALSVGDEVVEESVPYGSRFRIRSIDGDRVYFNSMELSYQATRFRKVAAPGKKLVLTFTRIYADAYRDEQETA